MERDEDVVREIDSLVDEYRTTCLWFMPADYYPRTREQRIRALGYIERHGDRDGFRRAATLKRWLSRDSNAISAGS